MKRNVAVIVVLMAGVVAGFSLTPQSPAGSQPVTRQGDQRPRT
jgi:hypothetical protein